MFYGTSMAPRGGAVHGSTWICLRQHIPPGMEAHGRTPGMEQPCGQPSAKEPEINFCESWNGLWNMFSGQ